MSKVENPSVAVSGMALLKSQYGLAVFNIAVSALVLRLLSKVEFAVLAVLEILIALAMFSELGLASLFLQQAPAGLQAGGKRAEEALGLIKLAVYLRVAVLIFLGGIAIIMAPLLSQLFLKTPDYAPHIQLLTAGALAAVLLDTLHLVAQTAQKFTLSARWLLITGVLRQLLPLALFFSWGFWGYLSGLVGAIVTAAWGMGWSLREYIFNNARLAPTWEALRSGFPFYLRGFLRFGFMQFDQTLVGALLSPNILAVYSLSRRFTGYIFTATTSFQTPMMVRAAAFKDELAEARGIFARQVSRYVSLTMIPICVGMACASPWLIRAFGGLKYADGWPVLALLSMAQIGYALFGNVGLQVFALRPPWATLALDGVVGLVNYSFAPLLISILGVYGVAWGQMAGFAVGILVGVHLLRPFPEIRFDRTVARLLFFPLTLALLVMIGGQLVYFTMWMAPFYYLLAAFLFIWMVGRRLTEADWAQLQKVVPVRALTFLDRVRGVLGQRPYKKVYYN